MAYKRKRVYAPNATWGSKKRRTFRKRRTFKRSSRGVNQTSKALNGQSLNFKSRKLSSRRFRSLLWNSTILSSHYRSLQSVATSITTQASAAVGTIGITRPLWFSSNAFWTAAGGATSIDASVAVPLFRGDIVLRGGMFGMQCRNSSSTLPIGLKIFVGFSIALPSATNIPGTSNLGWDPTINPAINAEYAKFRYNTTVQLEPGETFKLERRVRMQKIDQDVWAANGHMPTVLVFAFNLNHTTAVTVDLTNYYNLSFCGDAIGAT